MIYFHNMSATTIEIDALKKARASHIPVNICMSAYTFETERHTVQKHSIIRDYADCLIIDSGFKSAVKYDKKHCTDYMRTEWMNKTKRVTEISNIVGADVVSMMDIPLDAFDLARDTWYIQKELNYKLACEFSNIRLTANKLYVLQGYLPEDYLEAYERYNVLLGDNDWIGFGRLCTHYPKKLLFETVTRLRKICNYHIHVFGITSKKYLDELSTIGIDSADGSVAFRRAMKVQGTKIDRVKCTFEAIKAFNKTNVNNKGGKHNV